MKTFSLFVCVITCAPITCLCMAKSALGKGLSALISTRPPAIRLEAEPGDKVHQASLSNIVPSPLQPRKDFARDALNEWSSRFASIDHPAVDRARVGGRHELIAGERRWRAAQKAGLAEAPVIVREATDRDVLELALIENLQREDLNPIEEARAFARLAREFDLRQEDIAQKVGKSRAAVANSMRLLDLHAEVQTWLTQDRISVGHAKVLSLKSHDEQRLLAEEIIRQSLTVRADGKAHREAFRAQWHAEADAWRQFRHGVTFASDPASAEPAPAASRHPRRAASPRKTRRIEIEYYGDDDLHRILAALGLSASDT